MSQQPYHDPYRVNPNPINTTSSLNQPGIIGTTGTTGTTYSTTPTGTFIPPTSTYQPTTLITQPTTEGHGLIHRKKRKEGERYSSSSSSSSEEKKRKQQMGQNQPQKKGFVEKIKEKAGNFMHKSDKQKTTQ